MPIDSGGPQGFRALAFEPVALDPRVHLLTVDVEDWFHANFQSTPELESGSLPSRLESGVAATLDLLAESQAQATFFVLGCVARGHRQVVRRIADAGHEIGSHALDHELVYEMAPARFREASEAARKRLQDQSGQPVLGFRAPSFSVVPGTEWAFDTLLEEGYRYDSSLFPIRQHPTYGYPDGERDPYWITRPSGRIAEIPPATLRLVGTNLPAAGGAYFRMLPYALIRSALRSAHDRRAPGTFFIHPWELDQERPQDCVLPRLVQLRLFGGRGRVWSRLDRLFSEFRFGPISDTLSAMESQALVG